MPRTSAVILGVWGMAVVVEGKGACAGPMVRLLATLSSEDFLVPVIVAGIGDDLRGRISGEA